MYNSLMDLVDGGIYSGIPRDIKVKEVYFADTDFSHRIFMFVDETKNHITEAFVCQNFTRAIIATPPYLSGNYCYIILFKPVRPSFRVSH